MSGAARMRLLQLASQALPIGGFSHSLGLEAAVEARIVHDEATLAVWMGDLLRHCAARYELPQLQRFLAAWRRGDAAAARRLNLEFLAARETAELRAASIQMGFSLRALLEKLDPAPTALIGGLRDMPELALPCAWALAGVAWSLSDEETAAAYLWSWAEGQVLAAMKAIPLGQTAGQRVLLRVGESMDALLASMRMQPVTAEAAALSNFAPMLAILSAQHETQYSRLFRS